MTLNVQQAIAAVKLEMPAVPKSEQHGQGYKFQGIAAIVAAAAPLLAKHGVIVVPDVVERTSERLKAASGNTVMHEVCLRVAYKVYGPAGDFVEGSAWGEARDASDKATPKAMTGAYKAFLRQLLDVSEFEHDEDPDHSDPEPVAAIEYASAAEVKELVAKIKAQSDKVQAKLKADLAEAGLSFTKKLTRSELDTIESWLPQTSEEPAPVVGDAGSSVPPSDLQERAAELAEMAKNPQDRSDPVLPVGDRD